MYKLHVLYVQLVDFNNNKFMLDVTLNWSTKVFSGDFNLQMQFRAYKGKETD